MRKESSGKGWIRREVNVEIKSTTSHEEEMKTISAVARGVFILMSVIFLPSVSTANVRFDISARIIDYGVYGKNEVTYTKQANNPMGHINVTKGVDILTPTTRVPARIGTNFGFRFELNGQTGGRYIKYVRIIKTPRLTNPNNGKTTEVFEDIISAPAGRVLFAGYMFEYEWELVPGEYTIQVLHDNKVLVEKTFHIYRPE